jgi:omega-amidase
MNIALIQMMVRTDPDENIRIALTRCREAAGQGADLIVLPEMFCCPYETAAFPRYAGRDGGKNWQTLSALAKELHVYLVAGSMPEEENGKVYNTSYVFDRDGQQIAKHRKMHLFDCDLPTVQFHESETLSAGNAVTTFETEYGTIGLMICFDIRFPELSRLMADRGAQLLIVPAAFNMTSGPRWWDLMFRSRATDNQLFIAGCSPARNEHSSYVAWGHSIVVDPAGTVCAQLDEKEAILSCTIDLSQVAATRAGYKIFTARRHDLYQLLDKSV